MYNIMTHAAGKDPDNFINYPDLTEGGVHMGEHFLEAYMLCILKGTPDLMIEWVAADRQEKVRIVKRYIPDFESYILELGNAVALKRGGN